ncbi:putative PEP-binding protein [Micromonospora sp. BQ11]|uniref:putative PEP-binding protein n=1 Tax=Micromonospora sp. BQ11 TaxID=3452212 RepID=UPI003F8B9329
MVSSLRLAVRSTIEDGVTPEGATSWCWVLASWRTFAMPLVATYAELTETVAIAGRSGVTFAATPEDLTRPGFGWEVETPAACLCTGLWSDHLEREYGIVPALCGIGTNDLTQFTLARPRRKPVRLVKARHEAHPAVLALLGKLAEDCTGRGISAVLSGAAGEDPGYRAFARQLGFLVSCPIPALMTAADDRLTPVLTQAVMADRLVDAYGVADAIGGNEALMRVTNLVVPCRPSWESPA